MSACLTALQVGCATASTPAAAPAISSEPAPTLPTPGPRLPEQLSYRITHSLAGHVGDLSFAVAATRGPLGQTLWTGTGHGGGSFLGFGSKSRFSTTFDPQSRQAQSWSLHRDTGSAIIIDEAAQAQPGVVSTHRQHSQKPEEWATLQAGAATFDPLAFLIALRTHGNGEWTAPVLEGRALWNVTATPVHPETITLAGQSVKALRYRLVAVPLDWQGQRSKTRKVRTFDVWLANTPERTPLALKTPAPLGEVRVELHQQAPKVAQR